MNSIKIGNPYLFLLIIPLLIFITYFFFKMEKDHKRAKNIISYILHILMCIVLVFALTNIRIYETKNQTQVLVLADVSYTNSENYNKIDNNIARLKNSLKSNESLGVITYGKNYEYYIHFNQNLKSVRNSHVDKSATNLEQVLINVPSYFNENSNKKIIIISDGQETDNHALNAIDTLIQNNIYVDAIYLNRELSLNEVQISDIAYTKKSYLNSEEFLKVSLQSSIEQNVDLKITLNEENYLNENVKLIKGINILNYKLNTSKAFNNIYKISISGQYDTYFDNNEMMFAQEIVSNYKVMIAGAKYSDCYNILPMFTDSTFEVDCFFNGEDIPYKEEDLVNYDEIILSNFNLLSINNTEEFIVNLERFVSKYGKTLITNGVTYSSGTSDEIVKKYNNMLPVQCENSGTKALALVIDASSSMNEDNRIENAIEGAITCLDLLSERDYVSVVTFGEKTNIIQPLTSLRNKETIIENIRNNVRVSYATNMTQGIQTGANQLRRANVDEKSMIVLTDGLPTEINYEETLPQAVSSNAKNDIYTSFINISCKEGAVLLNNLAEIGLGEYYYISASKDIADFILTSVADTMTNQKVEKESNLTIDNNDKLLEGINSFPSINGYNYARIKSSASTIIKTVYENDKGGLREVPICAYWKFGKGKVYSFTSDLTNEAWTKNFVNSVGFKTFINNCKDYLKPVERIDSIFDVEIATKGFSTDISISINSVTQNDYLKLILTYPSGRKDEKYLRSGNGKYNITLLSDEVGLYNLNMEYYYMNNVVKSNAYFSFNYSKEYDLFAQFNSLLLDQLTSKNGKTYNDFNSDMLNLSRDLYYFKSINGYLLITLCVLFMIDVTMRHIKR